MKQCFLHAEPGSAVSCRVARRPAPTRIALPCSLLGDTVNTWMTRVGRGHVTSRISAVTQQFFRVSDQRFIGETEISSEEFSAGRSREKLDIS
jgi:hypothetical protein